MANPETPSSGPNDRSEAPWIPSVGPPQDKWALSDAPTEPVGSHAVAERVIAVPVRDIDEPAPEPVMRAERIASIDVLRGVAVLGILLMNIVGFGLPYYASHNPTVIGGSRGLNFAVWFTNDMFFEGTMRAIFSMLFGAGVILLTSRAEARGAQASIADVYYRRTIWLIIFGVVHAYVMLWAGDVLYAYGVVGLLLYPMRRLKARTCAIAGLVILFVIIPIKSWMYVAGVQDTAQAAAEADALAAAGETLTKEQEKAQDAWKEMSKGFKPDPEKIQKDIDDAQGGYLEIAAVLAPINSMIQSKGFYKNMLWDALGMMLLGMAFMKWGILSGAKSMRFYAIMAIACYSVGLAINAREMFITLRSNFEVPAVMEAWLTYEYGRVTMACGHIAVVMLICKKELWRWLRSSLAAVGRMALTNYLMQTVICNFIFLGFGLAMYGKMDRWQLYGVVLGVWILQLLLSPLWLKFFRFGPAEWLWRSLTYWKLQPILARSENQNQGVGA